MKTHSFQMRVLLWGWGIFLSVLLFSFWFYYNTISENIIKEYQSRTGRSLDFVQWHIAKDLYPSRQDLYSTIKELANKLDIRISYISNGKVIVDSHVPFERLDDLESHAQRPEVLEARKGRIGRNIRHSVTLDKTMLYVAEAVPPFTESWAPVDHETILRLAIPFSVIQGQLDHLKANLLWVLCLTVAGTSLLILFFSWIMSNSIRTFSVAAQKIGEGDYKGRIRKVPGAEFQPLAEAVNRMAKRIDTHVKVITDQKQQMRAMFEGMQDAIMVLNRRGQVESYNKALLDIFPSENSPVGRQALEVTLKPAIQDMVDSILKDSQDHSQHHMQLQLDDKRTMNVTFVSYNDHKGLRRIIVAFHDITEIKQVEKVLRDFVANASHQLRTPLTSIKGYTETVLGMTPEQLQSPQATKFLEIILRNADHMTKVISGMFALAKSEQSGKRLKSVPVPIREVLETAAADHAPQASTHNISIKLGKLPDEALHVEGDMDGLIQVFANLLDNAVKYSPEGTAITINTREDNDGITVTVQDQGIGIAPENRDKVFRRFFREDSNTIDQRGGAGLGLAICRHMVTNFGGDIWVDAAEGGKGSVFYIRLLRADGKEV